MSDLKTVLVVGDGPIKDGPALHGADIGYVYAGYGTEFTVDMAQLNDGWVPIVNPITWKATGKQGWIKLTRVAVDDPLVTRLLVSIYSDGRAPTVQVVR